ncbi:MAG: CCA tRNA nucleotidyltransferase [Candidatus Izemoplasmatales bacterium]|nr:CCA tRNA nucleotidyltransferase [Candidatus Izemoplasmatales bacterium]
MNRSHALGRIILEKLIESGYEAYFVGGFVRDYLLNKESDDIDITTNALPDEVEGLFENTKATGKKYGTITVFLEEHTFEVTTYRIDKEYEDYRRPESVVYTNKLIDDLKRRDFTINALAMDIDGNIVDLFNGKDDLKKGIIKAIGNPDERFNEDALRILRALRFVSKFNFLIEESTLRSMKDNVEKLNLLPSERVIPELEYIFKETYQKKAIKYMVEIDFKRAFPIFTQSIALYSNSEVNLDFTEFFAFSLCLENKEIPEYWRFSNKEKMLMYRMVHILKTIKNSRFNPSLVYKLGKSTCLRANKIQLIRFPNNDQEMLIEEIEEHLPIKRRDQMQINGSDLLEIKKIYNEEIIGEVLEELEFQVVNRHLQNDFEKLKEYAKMLMERLDG